MKVQIKSQGFKELQDLFKQLPPSVSSQVLAAGTLAGARVIAKQAKADAPRHKDDVSPSSEKYGDLRSNIKARNLKKKYKNKRAAIVTRGKAFWGDLLNRGTRYVAATNWYDRSLDKSVDLALKVQKQYMVAKITQISLRLIASTGANKK